MRAAELLAWLASFPPAARDAAIEEHLGIATPARCSSPPGHHLIGYHASGLAPIVHALIAIPVMPEDVVIDLGAGLGKVVLLTRLLTGARARGIELQATLVGRARAAAARLGLDVHFTEADARDADIDDGTIFFLYVPFTGPVLADVLSRLHTVAKHHPIVVCALGMDLQRHASWLAPRPVDAFWLTIYDSVVPGVAAPAPRSPSPLGPDAEAIAFERPGVQSRRALRQ
jgi:SAM-dependent methyltransferase